MYHHSHHNHSQEKHAVPGKHYVLRSIDSLQLQTAQDRRTIGRKEENKEGRQKKERLHSPSLAACSKERSPVLKGRAPTHRPREGA
eukprot:333246-Pelagomonas_calceolata.AAC.5